MYFHFFYYLSSSAVQPAAIQAKVPVPALTAPTVPTVNPAATLHSSQTPGGENGSGNGSSSDNGGSVLDDAGDAVGDVVDDVTEGVGDATDDVIGDGEER